MTTTQQAQQLTDATFDQDVLQSKQPVLVDFWAEWCPPCRIVGPTIDELSRDFAGRAVVGKLDVDANRVVAERYGISSIPTILLFKDGDIVDKFVGVTSREELAQAIERLI